MQSTLRVRLVRAENLPAADSNGLSDPYVVLRLDGEQKKKSETVYKNLNPDFSQDFIFDEKLGDVGKDLSIEVWDRDTMSSDFLGKGHVDVSELAVGVKTELTIGLIHQSKSGPRGTVYLIVQRTKDEKSVVEAQEREIAAKQSSGMGIGSMMRAVGGQMKNVISRAAHPQGGKGVKRMITIDVVRAVGVPPMDYNGYADPYIRVKVGKKRRTTRTAIRTLTPDWRERFIFVLFDMGGRESNICKLEMWDKDTVGSDDKIGTLDIDLTSLPLNLTDERWWKLKKYESKSMFGFNASKPSADGVQYEPQVLLLITVADLFEPQLPPDQLALAQKASQGWLRAHILSGRNLPAMDSNGKSDPFVVLELGSRHMRTHTIENELNPEWNTVLEMPVKDIFDCLYVHVYDEDDNGKFELIGSLCLPLLSMKSGLAKWYQLKDSSLQIPVQGCIKLAFHLNYLKAPMLAKCITRRTPRHMARPEAFKFKILKANIARIQVFAQAGLEGAVLLKKALTWEINEQVTIGTLVGWCLFWAFVQPWHITLCIGLAIALLGMQKFRGRLQINGNFEADAYTEEADGEEGAEADGEDGDDGDDSGDAPKKSSMLKNPLAFREQMRQMNVIARTVQNLLGEVASMLERVVNLLRWASPVMTALVVAGCFVGTAVLIIVPLRFFVLLWGVNKVVFSGLRKYHPKFKRPQYYQPINEALEFLGRVPDNLEMEQRKLAPLPEELQADTNTKMKTD